MLLFAICLGVFIAQLDSAEVELLQQFSANDPGVREAVAYFESLPDITEEELASQAAVTCRIGEP